MTAKHMMTKVVFLTLPAFLLLPLFPLSAGESACELARGWEEYGFLAFDDARASFSRVQSHSPSLEQQQEARIGLAMILQFDERRGNRRQAISIYQELLEEGISGEPAALVMSMLAECHALEGDLPQAIKTWDRVIAEFPDSIIAQDALVQRTYFIMRDWHSASTRKAIADLIELRTAFPAPTPERPWLFPTIEATIGNYYFWQGEYETARAAFMRYSDIANTRNTSYGWVAGMLYRIARISDLLLDDPETAGRYYKRMVIETRNAAQSWYALMQAVRLDAINEDEVRALMLPGLDDLTIEKLFRGEIQAP